MTDEEDKQRKMQEKSAIELALDEMPHFREIENVYPDDDHRYQVMRKMERAYEQLQQAGHEVQNNLKQRRYDLLDAALYALEYSRIDLIRDLIKGRDEDKLKQGFSIDGICVGLMKSAVDLIGEQITKMLPEVETDEYNFLEEN